MTNLTELEIKLAEQLLLSVKNKERNVTYKELAERVDLPVHWRNIGTHIGSVSKLCHELGLPLLSAKVVNQNTHTAGQGFYTLFKQLGIPTDGKTEEELCKEQIKAIRECAEWYRLEDYLGLDIGMPRPVPKRPKLDPKLLDAKRPQAFLRSVDVLNICFLDLLGKTYEGWMKGSFLFDVDGVEFSVWFPKLSIDGTSASSSGWVNIITSDGKTIEEYGGKKRFNPSNKIILVFAKQGVGPYLFRGVFKADAERCTADYHLYHKIADMADLRGPVPVIYSFTDENRDDDELVSGLGEEDVFAPVDGFEYNGKPEPVPEPLVTEGRIVYPRDRWRAVNALAHAGYVCEVDPKHPTFVRKKSGKPYTEPHHLVPMSQQYRFSVSLDVEENIVSLCSGCHNQIHYGEGAEKLLRKLYAERKEVLRSVGIDITEEELLSFYR